MNLLTLKYTLILLIALTTTSCTNTPTTDVDRQSLLRSMIYTQRNLLDLTLAETAPGQHERKEMLLVSYCDLINQGVLHSKDSPAFCPVSTNEERAYCVSDYHRCIGACGSAQTECLRCEEWAMNCLSTSNEK